MGEMRCYFSCPGCNEELDGRDLLEETINDDRESVVISCWRCGYQEEVELILAVDLDNIPDDFLRI